MTILLDRWTDAQDAVVGIDYGGTSTKVVVGRATDAPTALVRTSFPTPRGAGAVTDLADRVALLLPDGVRAGAVTVAGVLDERRGVVVRSVNLPWLDGVALGERVGERLGFPVAAVHDGRASAVAEAVLGAGRAYDDTFVMALGTGVAGASVRSGRARAGAHGGAGEIGHIGLDPSGPACHCGGRGCLEAYIGGRTLATLWSDRVGGPATAQDLVIAARTGDARALELTDRAATALGRALLGVVGLLDPEAVIIGGGLAQAEDVLLAPAIATMRREATFHTLPDVRRAELGPWAGAWGAVVAATGARTAA